MINALRIAARSLRGTGQGLEKQRQDVSSAPALGCCEMVRCKIIVDFIVQCT
jgi:hypothetical protein